MGSDGKLSCYEAAMKQDAMLAVQIENYSHALPERNLMATVKQPMDWWEIEDAERRQAEIRALNHPLPFRKISPDEALMRAVRFDVAERRFLDAPRKGKQNLLAVAVVLLAVAAIFVAVLIEGMVR